MAKRKGASSKAAAKKPRNVEEENGKEEEESEVEYEVEKIMNHRAREDRTEYLVRWKGYGQEDDTWEKESNLTSSALLIAEYKDSISSDGEGTNDTNGRKEISDEEDEDVDEESPKKKKSKKGSKKVEKRGKPKGKAGDKKTKKKKKKVESDDDDDDDEKTEEYEVERIIDVHTARGKKEYLVRWKGFSRKDDTWEPEEHLSCPELIEDFNKKLDKIKNVSEKSLRVAPAKTDRLIVQNSTPSGRHSKRHVGNRKSYAEED